MAKTPPTMQSWQVFHFARKHLSRSVLYAIFGNKNARAVDYWCENPNYTAKPDRAYDPIQGVKRLIEALDDHGHCGVVRALIGFLSEGTSAECRLDAQIVEPLPNLNDEILADFRAVAELQRVIEAGEDIELVEKVKQKAIAEIERTLARYIKDREEL